MKIKYGTIVAKDMEESIRFYTEVLGFEIENRLNPRPGIAITILKGEGETRIELIKNTCDEPGFYSLGMDVEDLNAALKRLKAKGAKIIMEPVPIAVGFLAFIEDPNGVKIALIQHH